MEASDFQGHGADRPEAKGARSYYPLFCTVSQTGQFLDCLHRAGNVHDSEGSFDFMRGCVLHVRDAVRCTVETCIDSAFFSQALLEQLDDLEVEFTVSVPFERLPELKGVVETTKRWRRIDEEWSYAECSYRPKSWSFSPRFVLYRRLVQKQRRPSSAQSVRAARLPVRTPAANTAPCSLDRGSRSA